MLSLSSKTATRDSCCWLDPSFSTDKSGVNPSSMVAEVSMIADFVIQGQRNEGKLTQIIPLRSREQIIFSMSKLPLKVLLLWYPLGAPTEVERFVKIIHMTRH